MVAGTLGRYQIQTELGRGGMGVVYRAYDLRLERLVAIKILNKGVLSQDLEFGMVLREARLASPLNHPGICTIYDVGEEDDQPYIAMEYVEGCPLNKLLLPSGLPAGTIAHATRQIANALAYAHERGVVHRDLKSSNVIISHIGYPKIMDFGLAKKIRVGPMQASSSPKSSSSEFMRMVGTLHYTAPEVLRGNRTNVCSDIWSLGVIIYEMATGRLPFWGETIFELAMKILNLPAAKPPNRIPDWISHVISGCMERDIARRYRCARDVLMDLPVDGISDPALVLALEIDRMHAMHARAGACEAVAA